VLIKKIFPQKDLWHRIFAFSLSKTSIMAIRKAQSSDTNRRDVDPQRVNGGYADTDAAALHPVSNPGDEEGDEDYDDEEDSDGLIGDDVEDAGAADDAEIEEVDFDEDDLDEDDDLILDDEDDEEDDTL
jgi:hypothetical protein